MESKFAVLELQSSITYDATNTKAVDIANPLPFLDWVKYFANVSSDPSFLLSQYKNYVNAWFEVKKDSQTNKQDTIQGLYVSLFKNIAVNYLTQEEKRFVQNADLTKTSEITAILPLLVRKIKDVCLYFVAQRERVKYSTLDHNLKSSPYSIEKITLETLEQSFLDPDINKRFADLGITLDDLKANLAIELEPLYDLETNYYDINPVLPASAYDATGDRASYFAANSFDFDPDLFIDFDVSVVRAIEKYPVILQELGANFSVNLDFTAQDLQFLKDEDFTTLVNDLDVNNLKLQNLKEALQHFGGTTFYYLSTNQDKSFLYGKLFEANSFANYLNRRFPTIAAVESDKLATEAQIGGFFKPDKLGILNFLSFNQTGKLNALSANAVYVFPDPNIYGNISGLSRTKLDTPFSFVEDVSLLKNNHTTNFAFGQAISDFLTKFKGYQSRSESLNYDAAGVSRFQDPTDYFKGSEKTIWANADVFPPTPSNLLPISQRNQTLLNNLFNKTLVQHKVDIYNNEFAFYKEILTTPNPISIRAYEQGQTITCLTLDGHTFYDSASGYNFNFDVVDLDHNYSGVTLNTSYILGLSSYNYNFQSVLLYPEQDFYKTVINFDITVYDGLNLGEYPDNTNLITWEASSFNAEGYISGNRYSYIHSASALESGALQFNNTDASFVYYNRSLVEGGTLIGEALSSAGTVLFAGSGNLIKDVTLYNQQNIYGDLYFRNYNGTLITAASAALSGVFSKYNSTLTNEIYTKLKGFDLILDTAVFETDNYLFFERLRYDYNTESYISQPDIRSYIFKDPTNITTNAVQGVGNNILEYNQFSNTWYNEKDETVLVCTTQLLSALSATNNRSIAINLYEYDFNQVSQLGTGPLCTFTLSATAPNSINIISIEKPLLNYNSNTGNYVLKFLAKDPTDLFYDTTVFFKLDKHYNPYMVNLYTQYPNMFIWSENFGAQSFSILGQIKQLYGTVTYGFSGNSLIIH